MIVCKCMLCVASGGSCRNSRISFLMAQKNCLIVLKIPIAIYFFPLYYDGARKTNNAFIQLLKCDKCVFSSLLLLLGSKTRNRIFAQTVFCNVCSNLKNYIAIIKKKPQKLCYEMFIYLKPKYSTILRLPTLKSI